MERLVLSVTEAADALGLSRNVVYQLVRERRLPAIRLGAKRLVVPRVALERFLEAASTDIAAEAAN